MIIIRYTSLLLHSRRGTNAPLQGITDYAEQQQHPSQPPGVTYVDDSQIYDYDHQENDPGRGQGSDRPQSRAAQHTAENGYMGQNQYGHQGNDYYAYGGAEHGGHLHDDDDDDGEMW